MSRRGPYAYPYPAPLTEAERRPLRVGFITMMLEAGGVERWALGLSRMWPDGITTGAFLCESAGGALRGEAERIAPVYSTGNAVQFAERCDVVLAWGTASLRQYGWHLSGKPVVATSHNAVDMPWAVDQARRMEPHATHLAAVSRVAALAFWDSQLVTVIHNGAELDRVTPPRGGRDLRRRLGIPLHAPVALCAGRIAPEKRPWIAREMLERLPADWHVIVAGPQCGVTIPPHPRCHVLGRYSHPGDMLDAATVFVLPSPSESHCLALNEAWLAGVPAVSCDLPVLDETVREYDIEPLVVGINAGADEWADACVQAARHGEAVTASLRRLALRRYTASAMAARWADYLSLITHGNH